MANNQKRPVNLDLTTIRFPVTAIVSIFHRISGVALFLFLPAVLWQLRASLISVRGFVNTQHFFMSFTGRYLLWVFLSALIFHLIAGVRHLIMDMGYFESLKAAKITAYLTFLTSLIFIVLIRFWIW